MVIFYIDASVLSENTLLVKFIRNYIRGRSEVLYISSRVRISSCDVISRYCKAKNVAKHDER